jgi:hypothetical protein
MGKASTPRFSVRGNRVGTKRSDRRWEADGELWDSRFEYIFYTTAKKALLPIERCTESDTLSFTLPIRGGKCGACGSASVSQQRTYTPDFRLVSYNSERKAVYHYIETKGYLRAKERSLLRSFYQAHPDLGLSFILQRSYRVTKPSRSGDGSIVAWLTKFLPNVKVYVWTGIIPSGLGIGDGSTSEVETKKSIVKRTKRASKPSTGTGL